MIFTRYTSFLTIIILGFVTATAAAQQTGPREKILLDAGWKFRLGDAPDAGAKFDYPEVKDLAKTRVDEVGLEPAKDLPDPVAGNLGGDVSFVQPDFNDAAWRVLDLPHDWAVELPFDQKADVMHGFKPVGPGYSQNNIGWYRRQFDLSASDKGKTLWLEFDGAYRNSFVWLNGHCLGRHPNGYSSFRYDVSKYANYGGKNTLVVRVDASHFEGWFYEGAGIYRHVWLEKASALHINPYGVFIWSSFSNNVPQGPATVYIQTHINDSDRVSSPIIIDSEIIDPDGKSVVRTQGNVDTIPTATSQGGWPNPQFKTNVIVGVPQLWSPESPKLYKLITTVESDGKVVDRVETEFGIRSIAFDPDKGFLLNGKPYFLKGTCEHQDHAGVGIAMPDALQYYRVKRLKEMGSNAIRTSHNPPTPELLQACDRLGMLVMDETRRMDLTSQALDDLRSLVLRDRNHPCVFLWSLGNEEQQLQGQKLPKEITADTAYDAAAKITTAMQKVAHEADPTRLCTVAMNGGIGSGISTVIDVQGWNYTWSGDPDKYHASHPDKPQIGTETASTRSTRGIYETDKGRGYLSAYDVNTTHYLAVGGKKKELTAEGWWQYYAARPYMSGVFNWTGFDYRGEPVPYKWPCIASHFGCIDLCGFPKDNFYYYQAWWGDKPVLHLLPHWNWPGQTNDVNVWCYGNCKEVELFLNGSSLGKKAMPQNGHLEWNVKYTPGTLSAKGYDGDKTVLETKVETTDAPSTVRLAPDRSTIHADGEDVSVVEVAVTDAKGRVVPVADNLVHFEVNGPGRIIGVGNGDPSSHESDKGSERKVFGGLAQVIVQSRRDAGPIKLTATSEGLSAATVTITSE